MSGNEVADYSKRDAALLLVGAVATAWALLVLWQWGMPVADSGLRSPPVIKSDAAGVVRRLPEDPGGTKVPNANREFQLAITAPEPASVWQNSRVMAAVEPAVASEVVGPVADPSNEAGIPVDVSPEEAAEVQAADVEAPGALIQPLPAEDDVIAPLPTQADSLPSGQPVGHPASSAGQVVGHSAPSAGQVEVPDKFLYPPEPRPGV